MPYLEGLWPVSIPPLEQYCSGAAETQNIGSSSFSTLPIIFCLSRSRFASWYMATVHMCMEPKPLVAVPNKSKGNFLQGSTSCRIPPNHPIVIP